jgi:hypothetical protein
MRRVKTNYVYFLIIFLLFSGCAQTMPDLIVGKGTIDVSEIVGIEPFEFNPQTATNINVPSLDKFGLELAENIAGELIKRGFRTIIIKNPDQPNDIGYIIRGRILEVTGGNKHQRIWLGFGYGASNVSVRGEIVNAKTKEIIRQFTFSDQSQWSYSSNETAVRNNLYEIANEIAKLIK